MRYKPEIKWSKDSWVYNIFRCYELIFGRKFGIRIESTITASVIDGVVHTERTFFTWESLLVHSEGIFRNYLKKVSYNFRLPTFNIFIDLAPQFAFEGFQVIPSTENRPRGFSFAIAFDASSNSGLKNTTPVSLAHTVTGSNPFMNVFQHYAAGSPGVVTSLTWNTSESLTQIETVSTSSARKGELWYRNAPGTGTHNIDIVVTVSDNYNFGGASYSGVATSAVDVHDKANSAGATTISVTLITTVDNDWIVGGGYTTDVTVAGANTTLRQQLTGLDSTYMVDTNSAQTPVGSKSITITAGLSEMALTGIAIKPFIPTTHNLGFNTNKLRPRIFGPGLAR